MKETLSVAGGFHGNPRLRASIAATETVSKRDVFRFLEMQFARADRNHDGELDAEELAAFVQAVAKPEADLR
jgi:hypothetical protein